MGSDGIKVIIFDLQGEYYAADIREVERILDYRCETKMPDAPTFVKGVINYEEQILPIIDLYSKFKLGLNEVSKNSKIIVVKRDEKKFGILVDNVYEVSDISMDFFEEAPEIAVTLTKSYIKGLIRLDNKIVIFLNISEILNEEDEEQIF